MIKICKASKMLKKKKVLDGIDLTLRDSDFVMLKGHNGSGKTMLLRMIAGLITPDEGEIITDRKYIYGVIIENPSFLLGETALYNLKYLASINKSVNEETINIYLKKFNLYEDRHKKVRTFSLGMKQRLALVQALMEEPDILLLDEPFNAIDDKNLEIIYNELDTFHNKGKLIIIASHGDYSGKCAFNRILTMNNGQIKE